MIGWNGTSSMPFYRIWDLILIELMTECISSVQYQVLLNCQPQGLIIPNRSLRQGDPLSPYIFIMCTEALIAKIKRLKERNN